MMKNSRSIAYTLFAVTCIVVFSFSPFKWAGALTDTERAAAQQQLDEATTQLNAINKKINEADENIRLLQTRGNDQAVQTMIDNEKATRNALVQQRAPLTAQKNTLFSSLQSQFRGSAGFTDLGAVPDAVLSPEPPVSSGQPAVPADTNAFVGPNVSLPKSFVSRIGGCLEDGNCSLCDVLKFFGTIAQWILATVGALALLFFVLGGFDLLTSQGKQEAVEKGKKKIVGALIGLLVVLGAYFIINAVLGLALTDTTNKISDTDAAKSARKWSNIECTPNSQ